MTAAGLKDIAKVDRDLIPTIEYRNTLKKEILPKIPEKLRGEASKLIDTRAKADVYDYEVHNDKTFRFDTYQGIVKHYQNTSTNSSVIFDNPEMGVKLDLLQARGIKVDIFEGGKQTEFITRINITENGVTHEFGYGHYWDAYRWIDAKLAEFAK